MSKIFVISDIWFNRILDNEPNANVVDNNEHIIQQWNQTVSTDDKVYVLGGFGIGDLYPVAIRLNGEIHFLNNMFNEDEKKYFKEFKDCLKKSSDKNIKNKFYFENNQMVVLNSMDAVLSYFPLSDWSGHLTGTYCFHGLTGTTNIDEHNISCLAVNWEYCPVDIKNVQENISECSTRL